MCHWEMSYQEHVSLADFCMVAWRGISTQQHPNVQRALSVLQYDIVQKLHAQRMLVGWNVASLSCQNGPDSRTKDLASMQDPVNSACSLILFLVWSHRIWHAHDEMPEPWFLTYKMMPIAGRISILLCYRDDPRADLMCR